MSKPTTKKCAAIGCNRAVSLKKLMCPRHWLYAPTDLKKALLEFYVIGQWETGVITPDFRIAVANIVKHVAFREGVLVRAEPDEQDDGRGEVEFENPPE
jgi:hypothetical protein